MEAASIVPADHHLDLAREVANTQSLRSAQQRLNHHLDLHIGTHHDQVRHSSTPLAK